MGNTRVMGGVRTQWQRRMAMPTAALIMKGALTVDVRHGPHHATLLPPPPHTRLLSDLTLKRNPNPSSSPLASELPGGGHTERSGCPVSDPGPALGLGLR